MINEYVKYGTAYIGAPDLIPALGGTLISYCPPIYASMSANIKEPNMKIDSLAASSELLPKRANPTDAGADLYSAENVTIHPGKSALVDTGVSVKIPKGYAGIVMNRSSQRVNKITSLGDGLIDSDYRGSIKVFLLNMGTEPYVIKAKETRIGQLVIHPVVLAEFVDIWNDTDRGTGGFGSTGK